MRPDKRTLRERFNRKSARMNADLSEARISNSARLIWALVIVLHGRDLWHDAALGLVASFLFEPLEMSLRKKAELSCLF